MKQFVIDCSAIESEAQFWDAYLSAVEPMSASQFGRNLDAFNDALAGGPGFPGECELCLLSSAALSRLNGGAFLRHLREIAVEPGNESVAVVFR
jgi:RNAse (barnase) inhibitor barstar